MCDRAGRGIEETCGTRDPCGEGPAHGRGRPQQGAGDTGAMEIAAKRRVERRGRGYEQCRRSVKPWQGLALTLCWLFLMLCNVLAATGQETTAAGRAAVRGLTLGCPYLYDPSRMLMECSGDIHPRPGPVQVEFANVPSLRRHWRQVMTSKADIVCLQETRLTIAGRDGMWDTGPGGVGLLYRPGMVVQLAARPPQHEEVLALWESGRWLHVHLAYSEGRSILNIQVVYGIVG